MKKLLYLGLIFSYCSYISFSNSHDENKPVTTTPTKEVKVKTDKNILQILEIQFPKFYELITKAGYGPVLENLDQVTIFAPSDKAFEKLSTLIGKNAYQNMFERKMETTQDRENLQKIINFHIVPFKVIAPMAAEPKEIVTLNGKKLKIQIKNGQITIGDDKTVVETDIVGKNGIVHQINNVILE